MRHLIYVTFSDGRVRGFFSARAAMRYADKRGLKILRADSERTASRSTR